ncbi:hypothetical protein [uncultured Brevundimonas sp.]|uniref:hypothetical protein n=1 Tax=uncultured Brevundimonas sp. TaxID=213418 RepID=UPI0030EE5E52|tara:strand:+ start:85035 stop:86201 length:1167 start_codon:yes stop_codon:yes gene_type:complete
MPNSEITDDDLSTLTRSGDKHLIAMGKVCVISLEGIATRFRKTWRAHQEEVFSHLEELLLRKMSATALYVRISDTTIMVTQPDTDPRIGQAICLNSLRQALAYFLEQYEDEDVIVHVVTRIENDSVLGDRLNPAAADEAASQAELSAADTTQRQTEFCLSDGRAARVSCTLEPLIQLKTGQKIGLRVNSRVMLTATGALLDAGERRSLSSRDKYLLDISAIARSIDRVQAEQAGDEVPILVVPIACSSITNQERAREIFDMLASMRLEVEHGILCELTDAEGASPVSAAAALTELKSHCMRVVVRGDTENPDYLPIAADRNISGVCYEAPKSLEGDVSFLHWIKPLLRGRRASTKGVLIFGLSGQRQVVLAAAAGATHASLATARSTA